MTQDSPNNLPLAALRAELDTNDYSHLLVDAVLDTDVDDNPMVGITVRLPKDLLQQARGIADQNETRVTTLIRHWVEQAVTQNSQAPRDASAATSVIPSARTNKSWNILIGGLASSHLTQTDAFDSAIRALTEEVHSLPIKTALR